MMTEAGYIHVHRRLLGHAAFRNDGEALAFAWMCLRASWQPTRVRYKGQAISLGRGQLAVSVRDLAVTLDRPKGWVERLLARLKSETMVKTHSETGVTIITICNYDDYQPLQDSGRTPRGTCEGTAAGQRQDTEQRREKRKERKKEESPSDSSIGGAVDALPVISTPPMVDIVGPAFAAYDALRHELVAAARPIEITAARRRQMAARLHEIGGPNEWARVLSQIRASPFLRGDKGRSATGTAIDWVLKPANLAKIREGNYDERSVTSRSSGSSFTSPVDAMRIARDRLGLG